MDEKKVIKTALGAVPNMPEEDKNMCYDYLTKTDPKDIAKDIMDFAPNACQKVLARTVAEIANICGCTSRGISVEQFTKTLDTSGWSFWRSIMSVTGLRELIIKAFKELPEEGNNINRWTTYKGKNLTRNQSYYVMEAKNMIIHRIRPLFDKLLDRADECNKFISRFIDHFQPQYPKIDVSYFIDRVLSNSVPKYSGTAMDRVGQTYDWLGTLGLGDVYPGLNAEKKGNGIHPLIYALYDCLKAIDDAENKRIEDEKRKKKEKEEAARKARSRAAADKRARERAAAVSQGARTGWSTHLRF